MKPFRNLAKKLHSSAGASIVLALLLFLVCALAGAAAVTAASANVGRYTYQQESQQAYLAVSSAARLVRDQLDGLQVEASYECTAGEFEVVVQQTLPDPSDPSKTVHAGHTLELESAELKEPISYSFTRNGPITDISSDLCNLLERDMKDILRNAFCTYKESYSGPVELWQKAPDLGKPILLDSTGCYGLTVSCPELSDVSVQITTENAAADYQDNRPKKVTVKITCGTVVYEMEGKLTAVSVMENGELELVTEDCTCTQTVTADDGTPGTVPVSVTGSFVKTGKVTTTVKFDFSDAVLSKGRP